MASARRMMVSKPTVAARSRLAPLAPRVSATARAARHDDAARMGIGAVAAVVVDLETAAGRAVDEGSAFGVGPQPVPRIDAGPLRPNWVT